ASFPSKTSQKLLIAGQFGRKNLQSHIAIEAFVVGSIYNTHTTSANLFQDDIMRDCAANHNGQNAGVVFPPDCSGCGAKTHDSTSFSRIGSETLLDGPECGLVGDKRKARRARR